VNAKIQRQLDKRKRRIARRLKNKTRRPTTRPVFAAANLHYDLAERQRGLAHGGIAAFQQLARWLKLAEAIDRRLHLLKVHLPYHESDHVLNFAYNALCEGTCLQDIELRRNDEVFLDALGAQRIPDPTTAGDFCRRFQTADIHTLQDIFHDARLKVWAEQPPDFFRRATIDMDGVLVETDGRCKQGMDIAYDGTWGYHPLVLSLAETKEVLSIVNRSGNRPSSEGAAAEVDRCLEVCFRGGFRRVFLRGDTAFSQTEHLDRWNADGRVRFVFGYDNMANVRALADALPQRVWKTLQRPARYQRKTAARQRPDDVKDRVVRDRGFEVLRLQSEEVAEFNYRPGACRETYRMVVLRKTIRHEKGNALLFPETRCFFYLTNDWTREAEEIVLDANDRCDQENLLAQLLNGCKALRAGLNTLTSNGAYMVMTALAWNLKSWFALLIPVAKGRWSEEHHRQKQSVMGLEFRTFVQALVRLPCLLVRTGRRLLYRLLSWNPYQTILLRVFARLRC
jgi:hypothetical protein